MNVSSKWPVLLLLMSAAIACYFIGFTAGFAIFLALGILFELGFWVKLFRRNNKVADTKEP